MSGLFCCSKEDSDSASGSSGTSNSEDDDDDQLVEDKKLSEKLDRRLGKFSLLMTDHIVRNMFRRHATLTREDGSRGLGPANVNSMGVEVARALKIPDEIFEELPTVFERFDFDGCGMLSKQQCASMFRSMLKQKRNDLRGHEREVVIPSATLHEKGLHVERELGRGGQGVMYLCSKVGDKEPYCVKFYNKAENDDIGDIIEEYTLMKSLHSKYIAKTYEVFQDASFYFLVNEPYFGGDLTKLPKRAHDQGISMNESWWRNIFSQCLKGLDFLHSNAIIHCDIKEDNIMVRRGDSYKSPEVVLIDFGLCAGFASTARGASGTPGYIPPETLESGWWYPRGDIFSMGVTFFQLMVGQTPSSDGSIMGVLQPSASGSMALVKMATELILPWDQFPPDMPVLRDLLTHMLDRDRRLRPKAPQALQHQWFSPSYSAKACEPKALGLVGRAAVHSGKEELLVELVTGQSLAQLRALRDALRASDKAGLGLMARPRLAEIMTEHGVSTAAVSGYAGTGHAGHGVSTGHAAPARYAKLMQEALRAKEDYTLQFLQDVWVDAAHAIGHDSGTLPEAEVAELLDDEAFAEVDDTEALLQKMGVTNDGSKVSFGTFRQVMLEDGRVGRRSNWQAGTFKGRNRCCI